MSKPAITSMIMYGDSGLELDVSVVLAIYQKYTTYQVISLSLMRLTSTEEFCTNHRSYSVKINKIWCNQNLKKNSYLYSMIFIAFWECSILRFCLFEGFCLCLYFFIQWRQQYYHRGVKDRSELQAMNNILQQQPVLACT